MEKKRPLLKIAQGISELFGGEPESEEELSESLDQETSTNAFARAAKRVSENTEYQGTFSSSPYGRFQGRHIIGECTAIEGGVYIGQKEQEAVVVDESYGKLQELYTEVTIRIARSMKDRQELSPREIVELVVDFVKETIPYSVTDVQSIFDRDQVLPDQKVALDYFVRERAGLARHQLLLAAYLLEKLKFRKLLAGFLCLERVAESKIGEDERLSFSMPGGDELIFSPAGERELQLIPASAAA